MIRQGQPDDAAACAAILNDWIDATPWMPRVHPAHDVVRHYREFVLPNRDVHVAGTPVQGFIALDRGEGMITSLFVARRGRGLGKALLDHVKATASRLSLWTFVANTGAQRFYLREGFRMVDRSDGDNEENLPDLKFSWSAA